MAFMSQERKNDLVPAIKSVLKKYGIKATIAVKHHSTLVVNISAGTLDLLSIYDDDRTYSQVNEFHVVRRTADDFPVISQFYRELIDAMHGTEWYDHSDMSTDYFCIAWHIDINVGQWNKPYAVNEVKRYEVRCEYSKQIKTTVDTLDDYYTIAVRAATKKYGANYEAYDRVTGKVTNLQNIGK